MEGDGRLGAVDNVLQVCVTPPPSLRQRQSQQEPLQPGERVLPASGGSRGEVGGGCTERGMTWATLGLHHMIHVKGGG